MSARKPGHEKPGTPKAMIRPTTIDLAWAAGFLEGEGGFHGAHKIKGRVQLDAVQVQRDPIDRLQRFFGGKIVQYKSGPQRRPAWRWIVFGGRARGIMITLYGFMSPRRQWQIRRMLAPSGATGQVGPRTEKQLAAIGRAQAARTKQLRALSPEERRRSVEPMLRAVREKAKRRTHCNAGHPKTPENRSKHGSCLVCKRLYAQRKRNAA